MSISKRNTVISTAGKVIYIILGTLLTTLGVLGVFLPILPTTPFLLLAAFFYLRSSKKLYDKLIHHKILGKYIYNYLTYRAVPKSAKVLSIIMLWLTISISIILVQPIWLKALLALIAVTVTVHLLRLKTIHVHDKP